MKKAGKYRKTLKDISAIRVHELLSDHAIFLQLVSVSTSVQNKARLLLDPMSLVEPCSISKHVCISRPLVNLWEWSSESSVQRYPLVRKMSSQAQCFFNVLASAHMRFKGMRFCCKDRRHCQR